MKYGLLEEVLDLGAYILGQNKVPLIPYNPTGDWTKSLPKYENQTTKYGEETSGCTVWGSQNIIETFYKHVYGTEPNYSENFTYLIAGITPQTGANPLHTLETIRKNGLVNAEDMPMPDTLKDFLDTKRITPRLIQKGNIWKIFHDFKYESLWDTRPENYKTLMKESLKTSPLGISVTAWREVNGLYVSDNGGNNHWCMCYKMDENGIYVFDSYDHTHKILHPDHNIRRAVRIWVNKKTVKDSRKHVALLESILKLFMPKTLLQVCKEALMTDASPKDEAPDEVGCANTVTELLRKVYPDVPRELSTIALNAHLSNPASNWMRVDIPQPEDIVISPTNGKKIGHVGIVMDNNLIASNNSYGTYKGLFTQNYTVDTWNARYTKLGLPVYYYRRVTM